MNMIIYVTSLVIELLIISLIILICKYKKNNKKNLNVDYNDNNDK